MNTYVPFVIIVIFLAILNVNPSESNYNLDYNLVLEKLYGRGIGYAGGPSVRQIQSLDLSFTGI